MAKSYTGFEDFKAKVLSSISVPRSDRFEAIFFAPSAIAGEFSEYGASYRAAVLCEELQLPGISATNLPIKIGAWTEFRNQNVEFLTQDSVFTFVENQNLQIRKLFEKWIEASVDHTTKELAYHSDIVGEILINVLDRQDNIRAQYRLLEAVPKLISLSPLSWGNTGIMRCSVSFAAKKWIRLYDEVETSPNDDLKQKITNDFKPEPDVTGKPESMPTFEMKPDVTGIPGFDRVSSGQARIIPDE